MAETYKLLPPTNPSVNGTTEIVLERNGSGVVRSISTTGFTELSAEQKERLEARGWQLESVDSETTDAVPEETPEQQTTQDDN